VTRITSKEAVEDSKRYGALAYLRKPLDLDDLENAVEINRGRFSKALPFAE
jgi:AmiR/NasT family two-component response regulator